MGFRVQGKRGLILEVMKGAMQVMAEERCPELGVLGKVENTPQHTVFPVPPSVSLAERFLEDIVQKRREGGL